MAGLWGERDRWLTRKFGQVDVNAAGAGVNTEDCWFKLKDSRSPAENAHWRRYRLA